MDAEARENLRQMPLEQLEVEQTRKLALKDSSVYLLGAGASMAAEGKRMCRKLREMLERIFYLRFFCTQVRRRTFFITAGEHKVLHILHGLGLSLLVELVKRGQQSRLPRGEYSFTV